MIDPFHKQLVDAIEVVGTDRAKRITIESENRGERAFLRWEGDVLVVSILKLDIPTRYVDLGDSQ